MNEAYVVESAIACALGNTLEEAWPRLCRGESAIDPVATFETDRLDYHRAACVRGLETGSEPNLICALMRRALTQLGRVPEDTVVIWAGVKGNVEYIQARSNETPRPTVYRPRHYRRWVCQQLGIEDRGMEVNAACAASTAGLALGAQMISLGECSSVLVCAADIVSRFTFVGFGSLKALTPTTCRPFDVDRDGLILGDGAAAILLAGDAAVSEHDFTPLARLTGWGISNDANHITGPARDGCGLVAAIRAALAKSGLAPDRLEAWCAHGTGTGHNDGMELTALEKVFGDRRFPVFSVKGAIGHTLGAAGAIETAICVEALSRKLVPATAALATPEPRAINRAEHEPQPFAGRNIMTTNSGFGGINAALVLETPLPAPRARQTGGCGSPECETRAGEES
ncbi:MAG: beta-ketoacyl synthase N-terminal-like domain-containing protein [Phycisphaerae bacterium]